MQNSLIIVLVTVAIVSAVGIVIATVLIVVLKLRVIVTTVISNDGQSGRNAIVDVTGS